MHAYCFPFGQQLKKVKQVDKTPKTAFILGVYASAVHARWVDTNGKQKVAALAVASEPFIFWTGDGAKEIICTIQIPKELGRLTEPSDPKLNGPSGDALDKLYLEPLGLNREGTWLCDLLPESRANEKQQKAIQDHYTKEICREYDLPEATIPPFRKSELKLPSRRNEILEELEQSKAETLVLLGDLPILHFLWHYTKKHEKLSQFGDKCDSYGRGHELKINDRIYNVIPLCHPRQGGGLGSSSPKWRELHENWVRERKKF
ncbi:MAG: hypothetical protein HYV28_05805 [Ignavibacteriales bacterium]|nr:hypothetical protein [Ignavibacteriales bacterium]